MIDVREGQRSVRHRKGLTCVQKRWGRQYSLAVAGLRRILKPMHMQPIYRTNPFNTVSGNGRGRSNAYISGTSPDVGADIFRRGMCLPSDNKMTPEQQDRIIEIIHRCFL